MLKLTTMDRNKIIDEWQLIEIDYNADDIPPSVKDLQPIAYSDGNNICLIERDSLTDGMVGYGTSLQSAMDDFQCNYEKEKQDSL